MTTLAYLLGEQITARERVVGRRCIGRTRIIPPEDILPLILVSPLQIYTVRLILFTSDFSPQSQSKTQEPGQSRSFVGQNLSVINFIQGELPWLRVSWLGVQGPLALEIQPQSGGPLHRVTKPGQFETSNHSLSPQARH